MEDIQVVAAQYLQNCQRDLATLTIDEVRFYAEKATEFFFAFYTETGQTLRPAIDLLCVINTAPNPEFHRIGLAALFPDLIEKLNDSFRPDFCKLYDQVFAQIISYCRQLPECQSFDELLNRFGLHDEAALLTRRAGLDRVKNILSPARELKKILLLSRVTIGADVAITSVMIAHLQEIYPHAQIVLLGSQKLSELFGGDAQIRVRSIDYGRGSGLIARLLSWIDVVAVINNETRNLNENEFCVFDPDSRLTQLGFLPVMVPSIEAENYFYFPSRSYQKANVTKLGALTSAWMDEICPTHTTHFPFLALPEALADIGQIVVQKLKSQSQRAVVVISFGVGGNLNKRINSEFEIRLVAELTRYATIILDQGISAFELQQVQSITQSNQSNGKYVQELSEQNFQQISTSDNWYSDIYTWQGGVGSFASLIQASDLYIGYDSSGQHFAAALGIPLCTVFVNSGSGTFAERWQPLGAGVIEVVSPETPFPDTNQQAIKLFSEKVLKICQAIIIS